MCDACKKKSNGQKKKVLKVYLCFYSFDFKNSKIKKLRQFESWEEKNEALGNSKGKEVIVTCDVWVILFPQADRTKIEVESTRPFHGKGIK